MINAHHAHPTAPAVFAAAITLSIHVVEPRLQRLLQLIAVASLLPSLGLHAHRLLHRFDRPGIASATFFAIAVTLSALAVDPGVREPFDTPKIYILLLGSACAALGYAALGTFRSRTGPRITAIDLTLVATLGWGLATNPRWLSGEGAPWFWVSLALAILTFTTRQFFVHPERRTLALGDFFTALWINGTGHAILGLRQAYNAGAFRFESGLFKTPMVSTIYYPNGYASFLAGGVVAATVMAVRTRTRFTRRLFTGAALLQMGALLGNGSRGALLSLLTAALLTSWCRFLFGPLRDEPPSRDNALAARYRRARAVRTAFTGAAVLVVLALATAMLYRLNPDSGRGRLLAWEISADMMADHPLRGVGVGRFAAEYATYQAALWRDPTRAQWAHQAARRTQPHSEVMYALAERGAVGVALFLVLWVVALAGMLRFLRRATDPARSDEPSDASMLDWGLLALLVALLAHATIDSTLHWLPVAVTAHLALGLVPVPALRMRTSQRAVPVAIAVLALAYAVTIAVKTVRDYPAYRQWRHASMGEVEDPLGALLAARQRLPGEAKLDVHIGMALMDAGMPDSATKHLERAILEHDDLETRLMLAQAYHDAGRPADALVHARAALASFPDRLRPQLLLARIHHAAGDHVQARAALARCIERRTHYDTAAVDSVAAEAARLWRSFYADEPPG